MYFDSVSWLYPNTAEGAQDRAYPSSSEVVNEYPTQAVVTLDDYLNPSEEMFGGQRFSGFPYTVSQSSWSDFTVPPSSADFVTPPSSLQAAYPYTPPFPSQQLSHHLDSMPRTETLAELSSPHFQMLLPSTPWSSAPTLPSAATSAVLPVSFPSQLPAAPLRQLPVTTFPFTPLNSFDHQRVPSPANRPVFGPSHPPATLPTHAAISLPSPPVLTLPAEPANPPTAFRVASRPSSSRRAPRRDTEPQGHDFDPVRDPVYRHQGQQVPLPASSFPASSSATPQDDTTWWTLTPRRTITLHASVIDFCLIVLLHAREPITSAQVREVIVKIDEELGLGWVDERKAARDGGEWGRTVQEMLSRTKELFKKVPNLLRARKGSRRAPPAPARYSAKGRWTLNPTGENDPRFKDACEFSLPFNVRTFLNLGPITPPTIDVVAEAGSSSEGVLRDTTERGRARAREEGEADGTREKVTGQRKGRGKGNRKTR